MATQEAAIGSSTEAIASTETFETIVIGGGQAGLAVGYYLKKQGRPFVILDANERIGGSWRTRTWSSLRLFTPARYDGLPGWSFPAPGWSFPTALEAADYLEAYAARFDLPVRTGMAVTRLAKDGDRYMSRVWRAPVRGRSRRRGDGLLRKTVSARVCIRARPPHRADALQRIPRSFPAASRRRSPRRRREFRRRHRYGSVEDSPDLALRDETRVRSHFRSSTRSGGWSCRCSGSSPRTS